MKNIAIALTISLLLSACSSGTTVSASPQNVTNRYTGTFENTPGTQSGTVQLDLSETDGAVTGNIIFTSSGANCLRNSSVSGTNTGFNMALEATQAANVFTITTTVTVPAVVDSMGAVITPERVTTTVRNSSSGTVGTTTNTSSDGTVTTVATTENDITGTLRLQFAVSNNGNTLSGTYVVEGETCSNQTGSGSMTLNR